MLRRGSLRDSFPVGGRIRQEIAQADLLHIPFLHGGHVRETVDELAVGFLADDCAVIFILHPVHQPGIGVLAFFQIDGRRLVGAVVHAFQLDVSVLRDEIL